LHRLSIYLDDVDRHWVTFDKPDARSLLTGASVTYAYHPTNRNAVNLLRNGILAISVIRRLRPAIIVSTGAGVGVPFCWVGRAGGARVIYVDSLTRVQAPSLSGRLVMPVVHRYLAQWPDMARRYKKAEYVGKVF
jgi:UDP-N-acetylglucosamine:LPS N-acetylglucosamine transferase